jgi:hypothetical protein
MISTIGRFELLYTEFPWQFKTIWFLSSFDFRRNEVCHARDGGGARMKLDKYVKTYYELRSAKQAVPCDKRWTRAILLLIDPSISSTPKKDERP